MKAAERRQHFAVGLSGLYLPNYYNLCAKLGPEWQPYSGMRDFALQDDLFAQGRTTPGSIITNARGGESAHNWGCATDWTKFQGETLLWLGKEDGAWKEYLDAVTAVGLRPGAEFGDIDHNELRIGCRWESVLDVYREGGEPQAQDFIQRNLFRV